MTFDDSESTYQIKLKHVATIDLKSMKDFIDKKVTEIPKPAINLMNLVIKNNKIKTYAKVMLKSIKIMFDSIYRHKIDKNSVYNLNENKTDLKNGLYYVIGQYLSIKPVQDGWKQNCDSKKFLISTAKLII